MNVHAILKMKLHGQSFLFKFSKNKFDGINTLPSMSNGISKY